MSYLQLLDWRRRMAELFVEVRRRPADAGTLAWFRGQKDELFRSHPQTPLAEAARPSFAGLHYWPYDPAARVVARFQAEKEQAIAGDIPLRRIGRLEFAYGARPATLAAFWLQGYAGGILVPFRDASSGTETYGGGRYLLDSIKSADLGSDDAGSTLILDFNYAYHPSCAYDPRWSCPLAPASNWLPFAVPAGERLRP